VLALIGVLPGLAGEDIGEIRDLYCDGRFEERSVSPALTGAAQLRASGVSSCWYAYCTVEHVLRTSSSFELHRPSRARSLPNPCRLSGGEHVLSDTKINGICILL
jgi:hypothetical protein